MATITTLANNASTATTLANISSNVKVPTFVEVEIDWAEALTAKGTALAQGDVIEAIRVPAGTMIKSCAAQVVTAANNTSGTVDVGITGGDVDEWVDGMDIKATAGTYSTDLSPSPVYQILATADTIDVLLVAADMTAPLTTGKIRVFAELLDVNPKKAPGLAALGS